MRQSIQNGTYIAIRTYITIGTYITVSTSKTAKRVLIKFENLVAIFQFFFENRSYDRHQIKVYVHFCVQL
jgi:hypothetical protein